MRIHNYMNINVITFRFRAWRINVNNLNMKQIVEVKGIAIIVIIIIVVNCVRMRNTLSFIVRPMEMSVEASTFTPRNRA